MHVTLELEVPQNGEGHFLRWLSQLDRTRPQCFQGCRIWYSIHGGVQLERESHMRHCKEREETPRLGRKVAPVKVAIEKDLGDQRSHNTQDGSRKGKSPKLPVKPARGQDPESREKPRRRTATAGAKKREDPVPPQSSSERAPARAQSQQQPESTSTSRAETTSNLTAEIRPDIARAQKVCATVPSEDSREIQINIQSRKNHWKVIEERQNSVVPPFEYPPDDWYSAIELEEMEGNIGHAVVCEADYQVVAADVRPPRSDMNTSMPHGPVSYADLAKTSSLNKSVEVDAPKQQRRQRRKKS